MKNKLKVLDLFSGIGGFSLGLERTGGFETVAFCEIDKHCRKVLGKNFNNVPIVEDIRHIETVLSMETITKYKIDAICGGFPCQDISVAGLKKGITNETRSGLWYEYKRIIQEVKPRWVIIENVRNLLNNGLAIVLKDLHEIGYNAEWEIISARSVGAPHLRERIWIVAYPNSERLQGQLQRHGENGEVGREEIGGHSNSILRETSRDISHPDNFRFWSTFATEEEKYKWWTEATSGIRDWWEVEPSVCRVANELPYGLDKGRSQRIKQLGNSIVPAIVEIIGKRILHHEKYNQLNDTK